MAKFTRWPNWQQMALDLKRGLTQLTFRDNFPTEPPRYNYQPEVRHSLGFYRNPTVRYAYYCPMGSLCWVSFYVEFVLQKEMPFGGPALVTDPVVYVSLPILGVEDVISGAFQEEWFGEGSNYEEQTRIRGSRGNVQNGVSGQWLRVQRIDSTGAYVNWVGRHPAMIKASGIYPIASHYIGTTSATSPQEPSLPSYDLFPWRDWSPEIVGGSLLGRVVTHSFDLARYRPDLSKVDWAFSLEVELGGSPGAGDIQFTGIAQPPPITGTVGPRQWILNTFKVPAIISQGGTDSLGMVSQDFSTKNFKVELASGASWPTGTFTIQSSGFFIQVM
jgi:hypothetical protein